MSDDIPSPFKVDETTVKSKPASDDESKLDFPSVMSDSKKSSDQGSTKTSKEPESGVLDMAPTNAEKKTGAPDAKDAAKNGPKASDVKADAQPEATEKGVERVAVSSKIDRSAVKEIKEMYGQIGELEELVQGLYKPNAEGKLELRKEKVKDETGKEYEPMEIQKMALNRVDQLHKKIMETADKVLPEVDALLGEIVHGRTLLVEKNNTRAKLLAELKEKGVDPGEDDISVVRRFLESNQDLPADAKQKLGEVLKNHQEKIRLESEFSELAYLKNAPSFSRRQYGDFLTNINQAQLGARYHKEADLRGEQLNSPIGRSQLAKEQRERAERAAEAGLDKNIQEKYLNNPNNPYKLFESAGKKIQANDIDGARKDLEQARTLAKNIDSAQALKDLEAMKPQFEQLAKEQAEIEERDKKGLALPSELNSFLEKAEKLNNEANILKQFALAKPNADIAFASFLLNNDKAKDSDANRRFARDIMMSVRFDELGKEAVRLSGEKFEADFEKAVNGSVDNRAQLKAFNTLMEQYTDLRVRASKIEDNEEAAKLLQEAKKVAERAAVFGSRINRDGAHENEQRVREQVSKQIAEEMAKPAAQRDQGKINLMNEIMKPTHEQNPKTYTLIAELFKDPKNADPAKIAELNSMVKNPEALQDIVTAHQVIQQARFQKNALNEARMAVLEIDVMFDNGENNPIVADIENDKYGAEKIAQLNSVPGHDGRTGWGDVKEATRDLAWYENAWKWTKNNAKDLLISLVSGTVGIGAGILAGIGTSWTGPGAVVAGAAIGFGAASITSAALHGLAGDKFSLGRSALDGLGGATGGAFTALRGTALVAGTAAVGRTATVKGVESMGTYAAFKAASSADKFAIALGGNRLLANVSAGMASSALYRFPSEALTGNYQSVGDWAAGSAMKVAIDTPAVLIGGIFSARYTGSKLTPRLNETAVQFEQRLATRLLKVDSLLAPTYREFSTPQIRRNAINSSVYEYLVPAKTNDK